MCQAIAEMIEDSRSDGISEGIKKGKLSDLKSVMQSFHVNMEQAMQVLHFTEEERSFCLQSELQA